jgi:quercetin dioxygenase-like cupin family protein
MTAEPNPNAGVVQKRFDAPDEVKEFEKGRFEIVRLGSMVVGRATYQPGWKWSKHVAPGAATSLCEVEHVGMVVSGTAAVAFGDGRVIELHAGSLFYVPSTPHDSWVVGDTPYVSLHLMGADHYAK